MAKFKQLYKNNLYYSDTDSLDLDIDLDPKYIRLGLGMMKCEKLFKEVVYLAPKVYGAKIENEEGSISDFTKVKGLTKKSKV